MNPPRPASLRLRLIGLTLAAVTLVWTATAAFTWQTARGEIDELLDAHLAQTASMLIVQALHEMREDEDMHDQTMDPAPVLHRYGRMLAFQIWRADGRLGYASENAPAQAFGSDREGTADVVVDGHPWRVFTVWGGDRELRIHVAERLDARHQVARELLRNQLQPLLLALPLLAVLLVYALRQALRPLDRIAADIAARAADNLAPLPLGAPREIAPLVSRLNTLFGEIARALDNERRLTADAAHELRTPLAALKAQAQVALAAEDEAQRRHALTQIVAGCDRAAHLVEQLLTLARLDAQRHGQWPALDLRAVAAEALAAAAGDAIARQCELSLGEGTARANGDALLLQVLLRNLVDNALRHGRARHIDVTVDAAPEPSITVKDDGAGLPAEAVEAPGRRFHRPADTTSEGSGLGLSIVRRIAELHGARLELAPGDGGGTVARITFP